MDFGMLSMFLPPNTVTDIEITVTEMAKRLVESENRLKKIERLLMVIATSGVLLAPPARPENEGDPGQGELSLPMPGDDDGQK